MAKREDNLKPIKKGELSNEEAKKRGSKGGKKSGEVRRAKKTMREMIEYLLEKEITNKQGEKATTLEAISVALIKQAMSGNVKAFEVLRDTIGQNPMHKVVTAEATEETKEAFLKHLKEL